MHACMHACVRVCAVFVDVRMDVWGNVNGCAVARCVVCLWEGEACEFAKGDDLHVEISTCSYMCCVCQSIRVCALCVFSTCTFCLSCVLWSWVCVVVEGGSRRQVNSRKVMASILKSQGISEEQFAPVCVVVDKLDKIGDDAVTEELVGLGGLSLCIHTQHTHSLFPFPPSFLPPSLVS